jgi:hypothetical protein
VCFSDFWWLRGQLHQVLYKNVIKFNETTKERRKFTENKTMHQFHQHIPTPSKCSHIGYIADMDTPAIHDLRPL